MKRKVTQTVFGTATVALIFTIAAEFKAHATPPSGLVNIPIARGTNVSDGTTPLQFGTDIAMAQITVDPGGSSGWHSHPGGAIIVVKTGTLNVYRSVGSQCQTETYSAGQAFIERPGELDNVLNMSSSPYVLYGPSRVSLRASLREPTSRTPARVRGCETWPARRPLRWGRRASTIFGPDCPWPHYWQIDFPHIVETRACAGRSARS